MNAAALPPDRHSIDEILEHARARLDRVEPAQLGRELASGALVVDIRPVEQRMCDGHLPGAMVIDRNVLEWRLDPSCENHIPQVTGHDMRIVIVCNEGFSSSLAAATLRDLGLRRATDMVGGYQAWLAFGPRRVDTAMTSQAPTTSATPRN